MGWLRGSILDYNAGKLWFESIKIQYSYEEFSQRYSWVVSSLRIGMMFYILYAYITAYWYIPDLINIIEIDQNFKVELAQW